MGWFLKPGFLPCM